MGLALLYTIMAVVRTQVATVQDNVLVALVIGRELNEIDIAAIESGILFGTLDDGTGTYIKAPSSRDHNRKVV